jgi:hypothetical protein
MTDWLQLEKYPVIVCRPALPKDTPEVMALTRTIWEGEDYVPQVWPEWLADPQGLLAVAEYGGRVSGLAKLTCLAPGEWWLEGLRVDPQLEGRGIASRLHGYLTGYWERSLSGILRLATASFRAPVQHLSEGSGFQKVGEFTIYRAQPLAPQNGIEADKAFKPLQPGEAGDALDFILNSPQLPGDPGLMDLGWQWASPSVAAVEEAIERGQAWWWRDRRALLLANEDDEDGGESVYLRIQLLACPAEDLGACLAEIRALAGELGYAQAAWTAPLHPLLAAPLESAAFHREWDASLYLYAKAHPTRPTPAG